MEKPIRLPRTSYLNSERVSCFREISNDREDEFYRKGYKRRYFFPHRVYHLPKAGPDGYKLATWMCGPCEPDQLWEIILYADDSLTNQFPRQLFFDNELLWHQQQFGRSGQIATANLVIKGTHLYSMVHISDLVQRISRSRQHKTRVENRFKGWGHMLLNSILNFAVGAGLTKVYTPTAELALKNTDRTRNVAPELFERIYDRNVNQLFQTTRANGWWEIDVAQNRDQVVLPESKQQISREEKTICLCHDIERGFGHTEVDAGFADSAHETAEVNLDEMLRVEAEFGIKATYNVLGSILPEVRQKIEAPGHGLGFHSYDHQIAGAENKATQLWRKLTTRQGSNGFVTRSKVDQLAECRNIDYRIKGYRPPQSVITPALSDSNLLFHNFEWLASSSYSLKVSVPVMRNRIVRLPILFDDFDMYHRGLAYEAWEDMAIAKIEQNNFVAFSLHDCYGRYWLPRYRKFLDKVTKLGKLKTMDEVAAEITLSNAV